MLLPTHTQQGWPGLLLAQHLQHCGHSVLNAFGVGEALSCALLEAQLCARRWHEAL